MALPSPSEQRKLGEPDAEIQALMDTPAFKNAPQVDFTDLNQGILSMRNLLSKLGEAPPDTRVTETESTYTTRDGVTLRLVIYTPTTSPSSNTKPLPLLVWYHGGGGCFGSADGQALYCREFALSQSCVVISPQYRLAPEHKFPTGTEDSWDALQHIAAHTSDFHVDPSKGFVVGGESFGSGISAYLMLRARDANLTPPITGAFLTAGSYFPPLNIPDEFKPHYLSRFDPVCLAAPGLNETAKKAFDEALRPDYTSPTYRASLWPTSYKGLPRTYLQSCGMDINRDDSILYRHVLARNGVDTRLDVYPGSPHCFWWLFPKAEMTGRWWNDTKSGLSWLFGKDV